MTPAAKRYSSLFMHYGEQAGVPPILLARQAIVESSLNPDAVSSSGAQGLAQFMPATLDWLKQREGWAKADPFNPEHSIRAQAAYMKFLLALFGGDTRKAVASYHAGQGTVARVIKGRAAGWEDFLPASTQRYLLAILGPAPSQEAS